MPNQNRNKNKKHKIETKKKPTKNDDKSNEIIKEMKELDKFDANQAIN